MAAWRSFRRQCRIGHLRKGASLAMLMPSWVVLGFFVFAPVCVMVIYSFLTKEFRGGVIWDPTLAAYDQFFL